MQGETGELSSETDTQDRWDAHKERSQETDTQIETWRQTLRERVKPAKRQERQREPSPLDHTVVAVPTGSEHAVGVAKGGALWGVLDGAWPVGLCRRSLTFLFILALWDAGILGSGRVRRGVSFADSSTTLIRFSQPGLGSQTSEEKILTSDNSHLPVLGIESKVSHVLSKSSTTELHPTALFLLFHLRVSHSCARLVLNFLCGQGRL